jgi:hypothetical protein
MKKLVVLLPVALMFAGCFNQERNCADFKTGKFRSEIIIDGEKKVTDFTRDDKYEIETFEGKTDTTAVRWINDCEFILEKENPKNAAERKGIHMKILTTKGNTYTFEFSLVGDTKKQKGTVTKLD